MRPTGTRISGTRIGTRTVGPLTIGLLLAGAAVAQAQTVTRQITSEPVETTITQGPNGTAVTRRILTPEPGPWTYGAPPDTYAPLPPEALGPQFVEPTAPALVPRRAAVAATTAPTTVGVASHAPARARTETTRTVARTASRRANPPPTTEGLASPVSDQALALSPVQRQVIYRTVVQREPYPVPFPGPVTNGYPLTTIYPADNSYGAPYATGPGYYATGDYGYRAYGYQDDRLDPYHTGYRWNGIPLAVGARIPASVPLVTLPEQVMASVPAARPYSYAVIDNRVFLVDPATGVIVAEIAR
jgi:hypothetical protein